MKFKVSFESAIRFTKLSVCLAYSWPPSTNATRREIVKDDVALLLSNLSMLCFLFSILAFPVVYKVDSVTFTNSILYSINCFNYLIKTMIYKVRQQQIQILTYAMEDFVKEPQSHEKVILQYYLDRSWVFHFFVTVTSLQAVIATVVAPLLTDQLTLPVMTFYPFMADPNSTLHYAVYLYQTISSFQLAAGLVFLDCQMALLMWYISARLEILAVELKNVLNVRDFRSFIQKHQKLLADAMEFSDTMSYISLVTAASSGLGIVLTYIQMLNKTVPVSTRTKYAPGIFLYMSNLLICTWPAENLLHVCDLMAKAAYDASWTEMSAEWMKNYFIIIQRSQRPVKVYIGGFIPSLSFNFYASFLSAAFSYFTTLRVAMSRDSEN